ncbi:hypothetical protein D039_0661B, partial [Vibrio parahaemolyticus EKP-028]
NTHQGQPHR